MTTTSGASNSAVRLGVIVPAPAGAAEAHEMAGRRGLVPLLLGLTLLAYAALAVGYVTRTPIWQNPDEPAHYNYIAQVAETGTLPVLQPGDWDTQLLERLKNGRLEPGDSVAAIRYEGWQPPLFYVLAAPLFRLGLGETPEQQVQHLRLLDTVLGGLTLLVAYAAARLVLPGGLALAVPPVMAGIPMFMSVSAAISADPLANLLAAVLVWVLVRALREPRLGWRWAAGVGALLGLGLLTKLALATFVPLGVAVLVWRSQRWPRESVVLVGCLLIVTTPWLVHQVTSYGWTDPLATQRHAAVVFDQPRFPGPSQQYVVSFATISFHSFWAQFGWMAIPAPNTLYWAWGGLSLLGLGGLLRRGRMLRQPPWLLLIGTIIAAWLAYIAYNLLFLQFQGRYLFPALVPLATLLVAGWTAWLPVRLRVTGALLLGGVLLGLNAYTLLRVLGPGFGALG